MWYPLITLFNTLTKHLDILTLGGALTSSLATRWRPLYLEKGVSPWTLGGLLPSTHCLSHSPGIWPEQEESLCSVTEEFGPWWLAQGGGKNRFSQSRGQCLSLKGSQPQQNRRASCDFLTQGDPQKCRVDGL